MQQDRDRTIARLEVDVVAANEGIFKAQERAGEAVSAYEQARTEMEAMRHVLQSRNVDSLVATLKQQNALKEKKMKQLQETLAALKDEFIQVRPMAATT